MRSFTLLCILFAAATPAADRSFTGYARDLDSGSLLYVETHTVRAADTPQETREVLYRREPGAEPFARKQLSYGTDRARPSFTFLDQRSGFAESVTREGEGQNGNIRVSVRAGRAAPEKLATLPGAEVAVIDAGFDEFVRARWDELQGGPGVTAPFLVPSRLGAVNFKVRKVGKTRIEGAAASVIRLSLAGPLGWFLPDIDVTYRDSDRRLLRYRGLTNIRDANGELLSGQIDFPDVADGAR